MSISRAKAPPKDPRRAYGYRRRGLAARKVTLDLTGPEWDWIAEQAMLLGIPFTVQVRAVLGLAAPIGNDAARFDVCRRAMIEARAAATNAFRAGIHTVMEQYYADPASFLLERQMGPGPDILASNPAWEEPDAPAASQPAPEPPVHRPDFTGDFP